jgi:hypothetical protein
MNVCQGWSGANAGQFAALRVLRSGLWLSRGRRQIRVACDSRAAAGGANAPESAAPRVGKALALALRTLLASTQPRRSVEEIHIMTTTNATAQQTTRNPQSKPAPVPRKGVDTPALFATIGAVKAQPELRAFSSAPRTAG